jgi:phosphatidylglycerol:prolipoprotein diacylglycerol transferase
MLPVLFKIGPFTVYGYGFMLAVGFIIASYILASEFKRKGMDPAHANSTTLIALVAGVGGSKLLYLIEHWNAFTNDPVGMAFNPGGLTFYGGFIVATLAIWYYSHRKGLSFPRVADAHGPALLVGYGVARIGCHLAGDGDYGFPTTLPWGTDYSRGTYPPSAAFRDFPEVTSQFPNGIVPDNIPCHPTPVYELLICLVLFAILWRMRKTPRPDGVIFMLYLVFAGLERFIIEFFRINPRLFMGFSEAQLIALGLIAIGVVGWFKFSAHGIAKA